MKLIRTRIEFLETARATKRLCGQYNVPLIINDRVDIALAVEADGVHLGQTDMPIQVARKLLPANSIIGISCNTREEVEIAVSAGADYVGIGPVYATSTKQVTNPLLGPRNLGEILVPLENTDVKSVAIGTLYGLACDNPLPMYNQVGSSRRTRSARSSDPLRLLVNHSMVSLWSATSSPLVNL